MISNSFYGSIYNCQPDLCVLQKPSPFCVLNKILWRLVSFELVLPNMTGNIDNLFPVHDFLRRKRISAPKHRKK